MDDAFFRELSEAEVADFRQWARDNWTPGDPIEEIWHPVVRAECRKIEAEAIAKATGG